MLPITSFFAVIFALMLIALSVVAIRTRGKLKVLIGDGGHEQMQRAIRAQANFSEYVPMALILMALLELREVNGWLLAAFGIILIAARTSHAYSLIAFEMKAINAPLNDRVKFRILGMIGTFFVLGMQSIVLLVTLL